MISELKTIILASFCAILAVSSGTEAGGHNKVDWYGLPTDSSRQWVEGESGNAVFCYTTKSPPDNLKLYFDTGSLFSIRQSVKDYKIQSIEDDAIKEQYQIKSNQPLNQCRLLVIEQIQLPSKFLKSQKNGRVLVRFILQQTLGRDESPFFHISCGAAAGPTAAASSNAFKASEPAHTAHDSRGRRSKPIIVEEQPMLNIDPIDSEEQPMLNINPEEQPMLDIDSEEIDSEAEELNINPEEQKRRHAYWVNYFQENPNERNGKFAGVYQMILRDQKRSQPRPEQAQRRSRQHPQQQHPQQQHSQQQQQQQNIDLEIQKAKWAKYFNLHPERRNLSEDATRYKALVDDGEFKFTTDDHQKWIHYFNENPARRTHPQHAHRYKRLIQLFGEDVVHKPSAGGVYYVSSKQVEQRQRQAQLNGRKQRTHDGDFSPQLNPQEIAGARYLARTNEAPDAQRIDAAIMSAQEEINRSVTGLPETFAKIDAQNAQSRKHLEKVHSSLYGGLQYVSDSDPDGLISEIRDARLGSRNI